MDIKQILIDAGVDAEIASKASGEIKSNIGKEFVKKEQYNKKITELGEIQEKYDTLEAEYGTMEGKAKSADKYKQDYDSLVTEYNTYKSDIETKEINSSKLSKIKQNLKDAGFNEKIIPLLTKEFELDKIELEEDNIKGWDELSKPLIEEYKPFISSKTVEGAPPTNPPQNNNINSDDNFLKGFLGK